jgi:hypothetical protein
MRLNSPLARPGIISAEDAIAALGPDRLEKFYQATKRAWEKYLTSIAPALARPPATFRATAMHALLIAELEGEFPGQLQYWQNRALFCLVQGIVIQVKKLNDHGMPENYPTPTAIRFARQMKLPGSPAGTRLTLGYMLNSLGTEIAEVRLLAQLGHGVAWYRSITVNQMVMPFFGNTITVSEPTPPKRRNLKPKSAAKAKTEKKSES